MTDLPIDPASPSIVDDIRRKIDDKAALKRGEVWQALGCPTSKSHMPMEQYDREFRGRMWFANRQVFEQAQQALRIIMCPKCMKEAPYGAIEASRFYITVEDDVMTVFPAVGHFLCHSCGFEEWQPLRHDPRVNQQAEAAQQQSIEQQKIQALQHAQAIAQANPALISKQALQGMAKNVLGGLNPGMGPIWGMAESEKAALHRLYQQTNKATSPPPPIVETREEAEMLIKMAPVERRQAIIQKLRDKGLI